MQKMNLIVYFTPYIKSTSKQIIHQCQTIKILGENIEVFVTLKLLEIMWKAWHIKEEIDKLYSIEIITFYSLKQTAKRIKSFRLEDKMCKLNNKGTTEFLKMAKYRLQVSPWKDAQYH